MGSDPLPDVKSIKCLLYLEIIYTLHFGLTELTSTQSTAAISDSKLPEKMCKSEINIKCPFIEKSML